MLVAIGLWASHTSDMMPFQLPVKTVILKEPSNTSRNTRSVSSTACTTRAVILYPEGMESSGNFGGCHSLNRLGG